MAEEESFWCRSCGQNFTLFDYDEVEPECPHCSSMDVEV